ncbi:hypothetical protein ACFE04_019724 [Oxalis oulophora]
MQSDGEVLTFTLGCAIPLTREDGELLPHSSIRDHIKKLIQDSLEKYEGYNVMALIIRVYRLGEKKEGSVPSEDERICALMNVMDGISTDNISKEEFRAKKIQNRIKRSYPSHITSLKPSLTKLKPFIVADTETILIDNVHKPYAAGLMLVRPDDSISDLMIDSYYSVDYYPFLKDFESQSTKVLFDLVLKIESIVRQEDKPLVIYFHNFARFDGVILLKHLVCHHKNYTVKPLMRNNRLYEIAIYSDKNILYRFRDSLTLLPGKLDSLAKNLCPELGRKGSLDYEKVDLNSLKENRNEYIEYMKQDIRLLGGVMQKAQSIYSKLYEIDIVSKITISSLALTIFRMKYYNDSVFPIHIPNKNEDTFIRKGYYGGHTDAYTPYGENLFYYDVNSLYPFVMKSFPLPGGKPVWHSDLVDKDLDSLFGFIEAFVECPKTIKKPFLPYRDKKSGLIFATGEFIDVYYSEELKYAKKIGYKITPICGYLFERMESPFKDFVSSLFESRLEAKKEGNEAFAFVYKTLMNSLYGRFGINPISSKTEICDDIRYEYLLKHCNLTNSNFLTENKHIVSYHTNMDKDDWNPPKNSAVQIAAAITANARIYMHPYISREDCYYTDTDSVVLGQPLPEEMISSSVLGKFKLEDRIMKGIFLAPKSYYYSVKDGKEVIKHKGAAKSLVDPKWFEEQLADPSRRQGQPKQNRLPNGMTERRGTGNPTLCLVLLPLTVDSSTAHSYPI